MLSNTKHKDKSFPQLYNLLIRVFCMKSKVDIFVIQKVKEKRKELGISQRGMAEILGCSPSFIGQIESDKFDMKYSVHQLYVIAQEFECSPADFFPPLDSDL